MSITVAAIVRLRKNFRQYRRPLLPFAGTTRQSESDNPGERRANAISRRIFHPWIPRITATTTTPIAFSLSLSLSLSPFPAVSLSDLVVIINYEQFQELSRAGDSTGAIAIVYMRAYTYFTPFAPLRARPRLAIAQQI